jgi:hypothetical protein
MMQRLPSTRAMCRLRGRNSCPLPSPSSEHGGRPSLPASTHSGQQVHPGLRRSWVQDSDKAVTGAANARHHAPSLCRSQPPYTRAQPRHWASRSHRPRPCSASPLARAGARLAFSLKCWWRLSTFSLPSALPFLFLLRSTPAAGSAALPAPHASVRLTPSAQPLRSPLTSRGTLSLSPSAFSPQTRTQPPAPFPFISSVI